jgi:hypothetical protein
MYEITLKQGRKVISRTIFETESEAFDFMEQYRTKFECELKNLSYLAQFKMGNWK